MRGGGGALVELIQLDPCEVTPRLPDSKERRLLETMLNDAIEDAVNTRRNSRRESSVTADARAWIFGEPDHGAPRRWNLGDFEPLCVALDLDPSAVRQIVRDAIFGVAPRKRRCRLVNVRTRGTAA